MARRKPTLIRVLVILVIFGLGYLLLGILTRSRGEWVCEEGEWVAVGRPRQSEPSIRCPQPTPIFRPSPTPEFTSGPAGTPLGEFGFEGRYLDQNTAILPDGFEANSEANQ